MDQQREQQDGNISRGTSISLSTEILVAAIIFFFVVVVFVFFLHLYARLRWGRYASASRRSRLVFAANQDPAAAPRRGLDPAVICSLPVSVYRADDFKEADGLECAVCLSELAEGEKARILPKCGHGFHLGCIDMWFHSHSTCPLCRRPVGPDGDLEAGDDDAARLPEPALTPDLTGSPNLPTNVLFWGTQHQFSTVATPQDAASGSRSSSSSPGKLDGALVIEIPCLELGFSSPQHTNSPLPSEDLKSPATGPPAPTRLRSFRRLLSREKRVVGPSCSPRNAGDVEQGTGGVVPPRTPTNS
uniref:RING-type E3 ubiquitin transferase n=1 Tax=Anthurium amnicola TaxID=1678845 RepID=A0A1D1ZGN4_9ARAE